MTDTQALLERLRAVEPHRRSSPGAMVSNWYRNPDGPEAADTIERLKAERDAMAEALTPSGDTKAAYHGEFKMRHYWVDEFGDEQGTDLTIPWDQVKEIMAAVRARAALTPADEREKAERCDCGEVIGEAHKEGCVWASPPPQPPHGGPPLPTAPMPHWMKRMMG